jgi:hypothetical protein
MGQNKPCEPFKLAILNDMQYPNILAHHSKSLFVGFESFTQTIVNRPGPPDLFGRLFGFDHFKYVVYLGVGRSWC